MICVDLILGSTQKVSCQCKFFFLFVRQILIRVWRGIMGNKTLSHNTVVFSRLDLETIDQARKDL